MDLNDFRRIVSQLNETERLGEDPVIEDLIERTLRGMDQHEAGLIRDALDVLKLNRQLTLRSWVLGLMDYRGAGAENLSVDQARDVIRKTVLAFHKLVLVKSQDGVGQQIWVWRTDNPAAPGSMEPKPAADPAQAVQQANGEMLHHAQTMEVFTAGSLARVAMRCGLDSHRAALAATQFVMDNAQMISHTDSDQMRWKKSRGTTDYGKTFRGWANDALNNPDGLED